MSAEMTVIDWMCADQDMVRFEHLNSNLNINTCYNCYITWLENKYPTFNNWTIKKHYLNNNQFTRRINILLVENGFKKMNKGLDYETFNSLCTILYNKKEAETRRHQAFAREMQKLNPSKKN